MARSLVSSLRSLLEGSDEQAMCAVKDHDDARAFARLTRRWEKPIHRLCTRMVGDSHRAEDLTQDVFTRLYLRRRQYQPRARFSTFLWRVALNICYDELRRIKRRAESHLNSEDPETETGYDLMPGFPSAPTPDIQLVRAERAETVRQALGELAQPYRAVVVLRHYEGLKFREIAEVLDIPEGTVKSRMAEALNQLSRKLRPDGQARSSNEDASRLDLNWV